MKRHLRHLLLALLSFTALPAVSATPVLDLDTYKGKVVYVDFWASWCGPCRQSFPWMTAMHNKYSKDGLVVVAVNVDQEKAKADAFLREFQPAFTLIFDSKGTLTTDYKVQTMPSSYLIGRDGKPRFRHLGFHDAKRDLYEKELRDLLAEKAATP
ncbi:MAG: TlpA disulfide reductase family protein [Moraxellaceae bacterium]|nr:TlpA disulfide reductase family protein [Moraxellaceae bacterium]